MGPRVSWFKESRLDWRSRWSVAFLRSLTRARLGSIVASVSVLAACAPKINVGEWQCAAASAGAGGASQGPAATDKLPIPWSDGFEDGFCGYLGESAPGYCYGDGAYALVTEPHRPTGRLAAEFKVIGDGEQQTRCVRQGEFPASAFYGAYYFIPQALDTPKDNQKPVWNLFHFAGEATPDARLWDVSLVPSSQPGDWELIVWDPVVGETYRAAAAARKAVPIGSWFHIELFLKRASDSTGQIALYQNGSLLFERKNLKSDTSKFSQWYVGDFAVGVTPVDSHLFVDDVSITATRTSTGATP